MILIHMETMTDKASLGSLDAKSISSHQKLDLKKLESEIGIFRRARPPILPTLQPDTSRKQKHERKTESKIKYKTYYDKMVGEKKVVLPAFNHAYFRKYKEDVLSKKSEWKIPSGFINPSMALKETKQDAHVAKHRLIHLSKELFINEFALQLKRMEKAQLETQEKKQAAQLDHIEQNLEDAAIFISEFIKENYRVFTKSKLEAAAMEENVLRREADLAKTKILAESMCIALILQEDELYDLIILEKFLDELAPSSWRKEKEDTLKLQMLPEDPRSSTLLKEIKAQTNHIQEEHNEKLSLYLNNPHLLFPTSIYFDDPHQLEEALASHDEDNLKLADHLNELKERLAVLKSHLQAEETKLEAYSASLKRQFLSEEALLREQQARAEEREKLKRIQEARKAKESDISKDALELRINTQVQDLYVTCYSAPPVNTNTVDMLTKIEQYLEDMEEEKEAIPKEFMDQCYMITAKNMILLQRDWEQKMKEEKRREILVKHSLEHAKPKTRKLMYRSPPPPASFLDHNEMFIEDL